MSATGRNLAGNERRADDFYATPAWCTAAILPHVNPCPRTAIAGRLARVLDPCCGVCPALDVIRDTWDAVRLGIELDEARAATAGVGQGDALGPEPWPMADLVLTNPPYGLALEFVERAAKELPGACRAFLLRLNFLGSQKRAVFHRANPCDVYVLPKRPSFTNGGTDATEYAWFVWGPGRGGRWQILDVAA